MLIEIYFKIDEFIQQNQAATPDFLQVALEGVKVPPCSLSAGELLTIYVNFHFSNYKCFKHYYKDCIEKYHRRDFPNLISYQRFVNIIPSLLWPLYAYLCFTCTEARKTGFYYIDSSKLPVCHEKRRYSHKVMKKIARSGKTSTGWFYGLKYHLVINNFGEIIAFSLTPGSTADNDEAILRQLTFMLWGEIYGDKGYLLNPEKRKKLEDNGLKFIRKVRKNMQEKPLTAQQYKRLNGRSLIESVINLHKNDQQISHTRHRSPLNAFANILSALVAYTFKENKPTFKVYPNKKKKLLTQAA
jgi:hypothetical protein